MTIMDTVMDTVIITAPVDTSIPTVAAALPSTSSVPAVEWMSHKFLHWYDDCSEPESPHCIERRKVLAPLAAAFLSGGAQAVIDAASGSNHGDVSHCWCLAMNAVHGRVSDGRLFGADDLHAEIQRHRAKLCSYLRVCG